MIKFSKYNVLAILFACAACDDSFLEEKPLDFLNSSGSLVTYNDYVMSVNDLYRLVRVEFYTRNEYSPFDYMYSTDLVFDGQPSTRRHTNLVSTFAPNGEVASTHWTGLYKIIAAANTIISGISSSSLSEDEKKLISGRAKFFRAFGYRTLAYVYGGVPLVLEEITSPKTDFVRATREEVYNQCIADLKEAVSSLPSITAILNGEIGTEAASHLLAEVYLAAGQYQNAASEASKVIDKGTISLMKNRFGASSSVAAGNVYWDLFQPGNQNRSSGNSEGIWVIQFETDVPGGSAISSAQAGAYLMERHHGPYVGSLTSQGKNPFLWPVSNSSGGRGIGWGVSTHHFSDVIWASDFDNDIRNANINFVREFIANNPDSPLFGQKILASAPPPGITAPARGFYAYQAKASTPGAHPKNLYQDEATGLLKATAGGTYTDQYMFRLAETYLIRAEAYLGLNDKEKAASDINQVRTRSAAKPVEPSDVTIDYILDERMRELGIEEKRKLTLMRLGLVYDRVKKYNPYYSDISETFNLFPIPANEIERNKDAVLEQNPGYQ